MLLAYHKDRMKNNSVQEDNFSLADQIAPYIKTQQELTDLNPKGYDYSQKIFAQKLKSRTTKKEDTKNHR